MFSSKLRIAFAVLILLASSTKQDAASDCEKSLKSVLEASQKCTTEAYCTLLKQAADQVAVSSVKPCSVPQAQTEVANLADCLAKKQANCAVTVLEKMKATKAAIDKAKGKA